MLSITISKEQQNNLESLALWVSELHYCLQKYGDSAEIDEIRKTIKFLFVLLDEQKVPFWVQNSVICWAEDWRRTRREYLSDLFRKIGVTLQKS